MHKLVDPQDTGDDEAEQRAGVGAAQALEAAGGEVTGSLGDSEPLMAIHDAVNLGDYDEIIISTLPLGISRWLKLDLDQQGPSAGSAGDARAGPSKVEATAGVELVA